MRTDIFGNILQFVVVINFMCTSNGIGVKDQRTIKIIEGGNVNIVCDSSEYPGQQIFWQSDEKSVHIDGNQLLLSSVTRNQTGSYGCYTRTEESNDVTEIEEVFINVLYSTKIISWDSPNKRLRQNHSYDMEVEIQGNPPPEHIFLISNQTEAILFRTEGTGKMNISIKSAQCGDTGTYQLYAINDIDSDVLTKSITVYCEPYVNPDITTQFDSTPRLGENIFLQMHAAGYPKPNFTWSYGGEQLQHTDDGYTSTIHLYDIDIDEFGTYRLDMENSVGKTTYFFRVIPSGPPEPPSNFTFLNSTSYSATVSWAPGYDYNSTQTFVIEDSESNVLLEFTEDSNEIGNITIGTISHLMPGHLYNVTISARNKNGTSRENQHNVIFYTQDVKELPWLIILGLVLSPFAIVALVSVVLRYALQSRNTYPEPEKKPLLPERTEPDDKRKEQDYNTMRKSPHDESDQVPGKTEDEIIKQEALLYEHMNF